MKTLILENALNHLLSTHQVDISPLEGKTIRLSLQDFPLDVYFICTNNRFFVVTNSDVTDVEITLTMSAFADLLKQEDFKKSSQITHYFTTLGLIKIAAILSLNADIRRSLDFKWLTTFPA
jgi:ubiquinone biosynthesis protein UbiJ